MTCSLNPEAVEAALKALYPNSEITRWRRECTEAAIRAFLAAEGAKVEHEEKRSPRFLAYDPRRFHERIVTVWRELDHG